MKRTETLFALILSAALMVGVVSCDRPAAEPALPPVKSAATLPSPAAVSATKPAAPSVAVAPTTTQVAPTTQAARWQDQPPIFSVYVGNHPADVTQYEKWLGKPADAVLVYTGDQNWADYEGSVGWAMGLFRPLNRRVLWSVSFIPKGATLADAAAGKYNDHWKKVAHKFDTWRPQDPIVFIRTAWEFNGGWFHYKAVGKAKEFIGAWRQFVDTFRSVSPRFRFDWCPAGGDWMPMKAADAYPGDDYVDVIGLDIYDQHKWRKIDDPAKRWKEIYLNGPNGLVWHRNFAKQHNKPMAYSEWGAGGAEAGDNPYFIEHMHQWFLDNHVVYASYWNSNSNYKGKLSTGAYPLMGEKYKELFGKPTTRPTE
jgi:hypothetical protein